MERTVQHTWKAAMGSVGWQRKMSEGCDGRADMWEVCLQKNILPDTVTWAVTRLAAAPFGEGICLPPENQGGLGGFFALFSAVPSRATGCCRCRCRPCRRYSPSIVARRRRSPGPQSPSPASPAQRRPPHTPPGTSHLAPHQLLQCCRHLSSSTCSSRTVALLPAPLAEHFSQLYHNPACLRSSLRIRRLAWPESQLALLSPSPSRAPEYFYIAH
ncbi:hypothetical protein ANO11243_031710 [Dothideomycetidae sp. 11243]|nr:hypothetical protein ANO11243_031710 [fungal sp. No.11243]